jgi:hypothetical protein
LSLLHVQLLNIFQVITGLDPAFGECGKEVTLLHGDGGLVQCGLSLFSGVLLIDSKVLLGIPEVMLGSFGWIDFL